MCTVGRHITGARAICRVRKHGLPGRRPSRVEPNYGHVVVTPSAFTVLVKVRPGNVPLVRPAGRKRAGSFYYYVKFGQRKPVPPLFYSGRVLSKVSNGNPIDYDDLNGFTYEPVIPGHLVSNNTTNSRTYCRYCVYRTTPRKGVTTTFERIRGRIVAAAAANGKTAVKIGGVSI